MQLEFLFPSRVSINAIEWH